MKLTIKIPRSKNAAFALLGLSLVFTACKNENGNEAIPVAGELAPIEVALDDFVADLSANPPTKADLSNRVKAYIEKQPASFFGSTVTLLDGDGLAEFSPYWYRGNGGFAMADLMDGAYHIDEQIWLRKPIDEMKYVWTEPYFDAGGGEIWMRTRTVPVVVDGKIIAVATTDLAVEEPK